MSSSLKNPLLQGYADPNSNKDDEALSDATKLYSLEADTENFKCFSCCRDTTINEIVTLTCGHYFCKACFDKKVEKSIKTHVKCINKDCDYKYKVEDVREILGLDLFFRFKKAKV